MNYLKKRDGELGVQVHVVAGKHRMWQGDQLNLDVASNVIRVLVSFLFE